MCADSCGVFVIGKPGEYTLSCGLTRLHKEAPLGLLREWNVARQLLAESPFTAYDVHETNGGPGQSLATYLPKGKDFEAKLRPTLTPSTELAAVAVLAEETETVRKGRGNGNENIRRLKIVEKRLDDDLWKIDGKQYKGSHFPLLAYTKNPCRRSPDANERRHKRGANRQ